MRDEMVGYFINGYDDFENADICQYLKETVQFYSDEEESWLGVG